MILKVDNLKKNYSIKASNKDKNKSYASKTNALNGINLKIEKGEFVGIMGPSGSGKTTLLNILSGIDKATSGSVEIMEQDINKMSRNEMTLFRRNHLGFVFQDFNLLDSLTLRENIMLPLSLECKEAEKIEEKINSVMEMFDIMVIKDKYPYVVSGGEQQRTAISRAIINDADIIFADEPTGNLDSKASNIVMKYFTKLNSSKKSTILVVTHDPFTASYCNRIIFIKDGLVNMEITKGVESRKEFFNKILHCLAVIGGEEDEF